ncbi:DNA-3-methyladenine glycosylase family protein [Sediminihabitans luteus]|uniref:DNA-3-methyladenine glycosylase family protein n=1 Tax=Sediminihabitans luteus TaxID=1138585 RepID=UPI001EF3643D|nr:DNA-3-methyladenine glycosylase 2 family protein [Sediminihabitans luteus]
MPLTSRRPLDLHRTLAPLARGPYDPAHRRTPDGAVWRTSRTPAGPVTYRLEQTGPHDVVARLWGPGAHDAATTLPDLLGEHDDPEGFEPPATLRDTYRRHPGVRIPRTGRVLEALAGAVLDQRVQSVVAFRSWAWLLDHHGEIVPGPGHAASDTTVHPESAAHPVPAGYPVPAGLRVLPDAEGWATIPTWDWHRAGVDPGRARVLREAARRARAVESAATLPLPEAHARLQALPGVGAWTSAEVARRALGDPDAVSVGDYHLAYAVVWALAGEHVPREEHAPGALTTADARMLELLAPYAGHRQRVVRLLELAGRHERPRRGPRLAIQDHRRH